MAMLNNQRVICVSENGVYTSQMAVLLGNSDLSTIGCRGTILLCSEKLSARPSWASFHMTVICGLRRFFEALSPLKNMKVNYDHDPNWLGMGNKHETSNKFKKLDRVHQSNIFQVLAHMFFTVTFTDKDPILRLPSKGFSRVSAWINKVMVWVSQSPMSWDILRCFHCTPLDAVENQWPFQEPKMEVLYHIRPYELWGYPLT